MSPRRAKVMRGFRVDLDLWEQAEAISKVRGEYLSEVIRAALVRYVAKNRALLDGPTETPTVTEGAER